MFIYVTCAAGGAETSNSRYSTAPRETVQPRTLCICWKHEESKHPCNSRCSHSYKKNTGTPNFTHRQVKPHRNITRRVKGRNSTTAVQEKTSLVPHWKNIIFFPCCGALWYVLLCCWLLTARCSSRPLFSVCCVLGCVRAVFLCLLFLQIADVDVFFVFYWLLVHIFAINEWWLYFQVLLYCKLHVPTFKRII